MKVEMLREGYLIKGTTDADEAELFLGPHHSKHISHYKSGRFRKVPGQWSNFRLHDGTGPGSFEAVIAYIGNP